MTDTFLALVEESIPTLRRYANALCRNPDVANDLVQDTVVRSLSARSQFMEGTNFKAWAATILRNRFFDLKRRSREALEPIETAADRHLATMPMQETAVEFNELARALPHLSPMHREILMLVGVDGMSYEESARNLGVAIGTVRSRLSRARVELRSELDREPKPQRTRLLDRSAKRATDPSHSSRRVAWYPAETRFPVAEVQATRALLSR